MSDVYVGTFFQILAFPCMEQRSKSFHKQQLEFCNAAALKSFKENVKISNSSF